MVYIVSRGEKCEGGTVLSVHKTRKGAVAAAKNAASKAAGKATKITAIMKTCGSLVGVGIAMGLGMTYLSYQLHRHGHDRLARMPFIGMIAGNSAGIVYSKRNGAW